LNIKKIISNLTPIHAFNWQMGYKRDQQESFAYCHAVKNGSMAAIRKQA